MKIYAMTATFGKLNHETITLKPGLNVIEAPNEWGKSTWCAFILAMLYGIDTSSRSKRDFIADKERYAPWSGVPMSGRMDIEWNGRNITIERTTRGRNVFGQFAAYETESGIPVPELTAANCGLELMGVEQSVFARAGFIRLRDMPVTQDESLRRRLHALVTTGDESDSADDLAQKLKDLKNRCRFNRSGLLPQAEVEESVLRQKLEELESLQRQITAIEKRQEELRDYQSELENHKQALLFEDDQNFAGKLAMARAQLEIADQRAEAMGNVCRSLPGLGELENKKRQFLLLQEEREALQMQLQLQPPPPQLPETAPQFRGVDPASAVQQAEADRRELDALLSCRKKPNPAVWVAGLLCTLAGIVLLALMQIWQPLLLGVLVTALGVFIQANRKTKNKHLTAQIQLIARRYAPLERSRWVEEAQRYADTQAEYESACSRYRAQLHRLDTELKEITQRLDTVTDGLSPTRYEQEMETALQQHKAYADALREHSRLKEMVETLESSHCQVQPPQLPDNLTFTMPETERILSDVTAEIRQLHRRAGQCQGRMETLGDIGVLRQQLTAVQHRIGELEQVYSAVVLAQKTLETAKLELQRRFAPRISQRAQVLFAKLTGGRYQRVALGEDLSVSTAAEGEDTLRGALWRSDGTADQLYLALRLAVAEELTPEAPLVLDDAFVRFDDGRLKETLKILNQSGNQKQVILFTCQSREKKIMEELL